MATPIRIPNINLYTIEFHNNTLILVPKMRHLTSDDVMSMMFTYSKIVQSTIKKTDSKPTPTIVSNGRTSYRSVLLDVFASLPRPLPTHFKVLTGNMHGVNGYQWCKELDLSIPSKSATDTLREVVRLVQCNKYSLDMEIELQSGERIRIVV